MLVTSVVCVPLAFQFTSEPPVGSDEGMKLVPTRFSGTAALPGEADVGEIEVRVGNGLGGGLTIKVRELERPLSWEPECGLSVFIEAVPGLATNEAGTAAVTLRTLLLASTATLVTRV